MARPGALLLNNCAPTSGNCFLSDSGWPRCGNLTRSRHRRTGAVRHRKWPCGRGAGKLNL